jgi:endonuclease/exonuclease/phosphatase family metal-dependent hydrolase
MKRILFTTLISIWVIFVFGQKEKQTIEIATFNIQNFGKSKLAKTAIVDTLAQIIRNFDIIAVQEISDISNQVPFEFLKIVNQDTKFHYKLACSKRTGQQPNDKTSQEQYAFYYNSDKVILTDTSLFDDSQKDLFQREPYVASFKTVQDSFSFIICTLHTNPELTVQEIDALYDVAIWIPTRFKNTDNIIFCGDFNASCSYASTSDLENLKIHQKPYNWIISDGIKTNLSQKTDCTYDRFVVTDSLLPKVINWYVYKYFSSKSVSDHWPVYLELQF